MMRFANRLVLLTLSAMALLTLSGCDEVHRSELVVESKEVGEFQAIDFSGVAEVNVVVGQAAAVSVSGDKSAVKELETSVHDGVLQLRYRHRHQHWDWFGSSRSLKINISTPSLTVFESSGAGSVHISGLDGGEQRVKIAGAHNIQAKGKLDRLDIELNGAGNIDYGNVVTQVVKVSVNGAGNVEVSPVESLDAVVNGVGAVQYLGAPRNVTSAIHGLGSIQRKDGE